MTRPSAAPLAAGGLLALAVLGPLVAPYDPAAILDAPALRLLPPGSRVPALVTLGGERLPVSGTGVGGRRVSEWHVEGASVVYTRGLRLARVPLEALAKDALGRPRIVSLRFPLGTDLAGRDLLSRLLAGARLSLLVGVGGALVAASLGGFLGLAAATGRRLGGAVIGRVGDALLALPRILLVAALAALFRPGAGGLVALLGLTGWPAFCRLVRADMTVLARSDLAASARAAGCSRASVAFRHLLPHALSTLLVATGLRAGSFVLLEASLSFLGFGIAPPRASWGNILAEGRDVLFEAWWVTLWPGALLAGSVVALNLLADHLRRRGEAGWPARD